MSTRQQPTSPAVSVADLAREMHVSIADVLVLVDQLTDIDGTEATVHGWDYWTRTPILTPEAADTIREQIQAAS